MSGTVYLLHFSEPFGHARHYIGWAEDLQRRLAQHRAGQGSNLCRHASMAGVTFTLAATWPGTRSDERRRHRNHHGARDCPVCRGGAPRCAPDASVARP